MNDNDNPLQEGDGQNMVIGQGDDCTVDGADLLFGTNGFDTINFGDGDNTNVAGQGSTDGADRLVFGSSMASVETTRSMGLPELAYERRRDSAVVWTKTLHRPKNKSTHLRRN